ncbi:MAG TPA: winged helix-turn-helix domain-containing protein [Solirubrobacterales bacterium]|nr:winged helix-turn-helix domain-containing protein [Solirubrobacterales bacterium]
MPPAKAATAPVETTLAAIVAHPTRARAFTILNDRTASPVEIAQEIGKDVGHVGYHVRKLLQLGLIELVDERPVRGAVEHFYRAVERAVVSEEEFAALSIPERESFTRYIMQRLVADVARSMDQEIFAARPNAIIARTPMVVDEEGFQEMSELHTELFDRTLEIQARSAERMTRSREDGISTISASLFFEVPERKRPVE